VTNTKALLVADPYPPYQYEDAGVVKGHDVETIARAFAALPYDLAVELLPWETCLQRVDDGTADGVFQITKTADREARYLFSDLFRTEETALFTKGMRVSTPPVSGHVNDPIGNGIVGVLAGYSYGPQIDAIPDHQKQFFKEQRDLLLALDAGQCDLILLDAGIVSFIAEESAIRDVRRVPGFAMKRDLFVAFGRGREVLVHQFNEQLCRLGAA
jgi:polar amino acid transport system substrate-binding protein